MRCSILIVEDHDTVRKSLCDWLGMVFPGCRILEAGTGEAAVALAKTESPSVVVMDIGLPGISGIETTRRIKAAVPSAKVLMLTIHEDEAYRADAKAAGATFFVPKRLMHTELVPGVAELLPAGDCPVPSREGEEE